MQTTSVAVSLKELRIKKRILNYVKNYYPSMEPGSKLVVTVEVKYQNGEFTIKGEGKIFRLPTRVENALPVALTQKEWRKVLGIPYFINRTERSKVPERCMKILERLRDDGNKTPLLISNNDRATINKELKAAGISEFKLVTHRVGGVRFHHSQPHVTLVKI